MRIMRRQKRTTNAILAFALVVFLLQGCATTGSTNSVVSGAYKTLATAATAYETGFASLAELYKQGIVSEDVKNKAVEYGEHFWTAYHSSCELLASYAKTSSAEDETKLNTAIIEVSRLLGVFLEYAGPYLAKK